MVFAIAHDILFLTELGNNYLTRIIGRINIGIYLQQG